MITRISGPLTKWLKVIKGQATPAFPVPFVPRKRKKKKKKFQVLLNSHKDMDLQCCFFLLKVSLQQPGTQEAIQFCLGIVSGNYILLKSMPEL